jgi:DNA-binding NarL/FixJ family response regulator
LPGHVEHARIAETLVVGETALKTHVARVLDNLDLQSRVQAAILAYEVGLVELGSR